MKNFDKSIIMSIIFFATSIALLYFLLSKCVLISYWLLDFSMRHPFIFNGIIISSIFLAFVFLYIYKSRKGVVEKIEQCN